MRVTTASEMGLGQVEGRALNAPGINVRATPAAFGGTRGAQLEDLGRAGLQASDNATRLYVRIQEEEARAKEREGRILATRRGLQARLSWIDRMGQLKQEAGPAAPGFALKVQQDFDKWKEGELAAMPDELSKLELEEKLVGLQVGLVDEAAAYETKARQAYAKVQREGMVDDALTIVMLAPEQGGQVTADIIQRIDDLPGTPEEKADAMRDATHALKKAEWQGRGQQDPEGVLALLTTSSVPGLAAKDRAELIKASQTAIKSKASEAREQLRWQWSQEAHAEAEARRGREALGAELTARVLAGEASEADVIAATRKRIISPSEGRVLAKTFEEKKSGAAATDNPVVYARLLEMQRNNDPAVRDEALAAAQAGLIKTTTMGSLMKTDAVMDRRDVQDARRLLGETLKPGGPFAFLEEDVAERVTQAEVRFIERMKEDPKQNPYELMQKEVDLFKGRVTGAKEAVPGAVQPPRFVARNPAGAVDPAASVAELEAAHARGEVTDEELEKIGTEMESFFEMNAGTGAALRIR
jgi:hypothetical protein